MYIVNTSCGNDSVALLQYMIENGIEDVHALYSDTGWAAPFWEDRVYAVESFCLRNEIEFHRATSRGMIDLVTSKKGWPMCASNMQFCTQELKTGPALRWMELVDPNQDATCVIGVRRSESKNRSDHPEWITESEKHGGRELWAPLVRHTDEQRNELLERAGFDVLPHRSMECFPCVCSNREDLRMLSDYPERVELIASTEESMGHTRNGKPRTMFRPYRHQGATGIKEVMRWALSERGKYNADQQDMFCDSAGWCGD